MASSGFQASLSKTLASSPSKHEPLELHPHHEHVHHEGDVDHISLEDHGIHIKKIFRNAPPAVLYEEALKNEAGSVITSSGALSTRSGAKTGRTPKDKRIVYNKASEDIWWGPVNIKLDESSFLINRERAVDYLNTCDQLFVVDGFAGWDPKYRIKVRIVASRAYHALFMENMLIRPTREELAEFGEPDYIVYNAGKFPANRYTKGMTSSASIALDFERKEMVILGSQYAGEMKKGVFTVMNYLMPRAGVLSMHASANMGKEGDVSIFFGLSGTGKTTLSADTNRYLIGDDEHVWSTEGVFNIEGGCYAKCVNLSREKEPEIYDAIKFGAIVENVVLHPESRDIDFDDVSITENTRCAYPLEFIPNAKLPAVGPHPKNIIMLTCDAYGVLPPVSLLSKEQAMYQFISGYTAKVAGTEVGVTEPSPTFSACFGEPFIVFHPVQYAELLAKKLEEHKVNVWLVNSGWVGGAYGVGKRISIKHTRALIDGIHNGELAAGEFENFPIFNFAIPKKCTGVPSEILNPRLAWANKDKFDETLNKLGAAFVKNMNTKYADKATPAILAAAPKLIKEVDVAIGREG